ncbi:MAG TPA: hypothetical protein VI837_11025, partial [Blastocatellia bacterium]|nr:hypothetical protein [Blastocatellia bacterium]
VLFEYSPNLELDHVIVNTAPISAALREKYLADGAAQVEFDSRARKGFDDELPAAFVETPERVHAFQLICRDVLCENDLVRHDPDKLARLVLEIRQTEKLAVR